MKWSPPPRARRVALAVVVGLVFVAPLFARAAWEAHSALASGLAAGAAGDREREVELLGHAARWRVPVWRADDAAVDRLLVLAAEAEGQGEDGRPLALRAYREVRSALLATRAWDIPREEDFHRVNERIAALMAAQEKTFGTDVGGTGDPESYHRGLLEAVPGPVPWRANLAAWVFLGWVGASLVFVTRAIDARGRLRVRAAVRWGGVTLVLMVGWMLLTRHAGGIP